MRRTYLDIFIIPPQTQEKKTLEDESINYWKKRNSKILSLFVIQITLSAIIVITIYIQKFKGVNPEESYITITLGLICILITTSNIIYSFFLFLSSIYSILLYKNKSMLQAYFISFVAYFFVFKNIDKPTTIDLVTDIRMAFSYLPIIYFLLVRYKIRKINTYFSEF